MLTIAGAQREGYQRGFLHGGCVGAGVMLLAVALVSCEGDKPTHYQLPGPGSGFAAVPAADCPTIAELERGLATVLTELEADVKACERRVESLLNCCAASAGTGPAPAGDG